MHFLRKIYSENSYIVLLLISYFVLGLFVVLFVRKGDDVIWLNQFHQPFADFFFQYFTHFGDGLFCLLVSAVFLVFRQCRNAILIFAVFAVSGLLSQFFKKILFPDVLRPAAYLKNVSLHFVEGVEILSNNSFPSGHTATAFACFLMLAFIFKKTNWSIIFFIFVLLVSISRIYLCQHFFVDTYAGAWLGVISTILIYYLAHLKLKKQNNFA